MAGRGGRGGGGGGARGLSAGAVRALLPTNESASLWNWTLSPGTAAVDYARGPRAGSNAGLTLLDDGERNRRQGGRKRR